MSWRPRVTVIVPLYNKAPYVSRCLDSILAQSFQDFEVVVVNDGSTDGSEQVVRPYLSERLRLVDQPNAGPGAARNRGAQEASGELLAFQDADDTWDRGYLHRSVSLVDSCGAEVAGVTCGFKVHPQGTTTERRWRRLGIPEGVFRLTARTPLSQFAGIMSLITAQATIVRRDPFLRCGGFYAKNRCAFAEDTHLWIKLMARYPFAFDPAPVMTRFCDTSALSIGRAGLRPVEPFLLDPEDVLDQCPPDLVPLIRRFLALRACKTASVYGYFGRYDMARTLVRRFVSIRDWRLPLLPVALVSCTPLARPLAAIASAAGMNLRESNAE